MQYRRSKAKIARLKDEIQKLADLCAGLPCTATDGDKVQSSHDPDRIGKVIAEKADLEDELMDEVLNSIDAMNGIIETINKLSDVSYQNVIQMRYIRFDEDTFQLKTWAEIADELHYSERWVQTIHGRALVEVERIING